MKNARLSAFDMLYDIIYGGAYSNIVLEKGLKSVESKDKGFVSRLVGDKTVNGYEVPDNILVQVLATDENHTCLKSGQKNGLLEALDIGTVWLKKELG